MSIWYCNGCVLNRDWFAFVVLVLCRNCCLIMLLVCEFTCGFGSEALDCDLCTAAVK